MKRRKLLYAQSGGVTAVINATAAAVIEAAGARAAEHDGLLAARHGILGVLGEDFVDPSSLDAGDLALLRQTPGGVFGSSRFDLDPPDRHPAQYERIFDVFAAHDVGAFLYNGGNGSMDTVLKLSAAARVRGYPLRCIGVPKTVDNDLVGTDCSPGFGSAAKFVATSMREAGRDIAAMASPSGRVFVMEVMGRNAGWIAAATSLAARRPDDPPHLILLPEVPFAEEAFLARVDAWVRRLGYCAITVAEGARDGSGRLLAEQARDALGYIQLGGAGRCIARLIADRLGYKYHGATPDYLQRAAAHLVSATDLAQAEAVGRAAVDYALAGMDAVMPALRRLGDVPYAWTIEARPLAEVANLERHLPAEFVTADGFGINDAGRRYLAPLIAGERQVIYRDGLPAHLEHQLLPLSRRLGAWPA